MKKSVNKQFSFSYSYKLNISQKVIVILSIILSIILFLVFKPIDTSSVVSASYPIQNYSEAVQQISKLQSDEGEEINNLCRTRLFTHNKKVEQSIVFFHGITNCPQQFEKLGMEFYKKGYNVYIPLLPHHGRKDRMTQALKDLTAQELSLVADRSVDEANGLGDEVVVVGISAGGLMTAWAGMNRDDVDHAVVIAPNFSYIYPKQFSLPLTNLALVVPNYFRWWDDKLKDKIDGPLDYAYPRYSTHAMGELFRLGFAIRNHAIQNAPKAQKITVVTIEGDEAVNNEITQDVVNLWRKRGYAQVKTYEFPKELELIHDIIDPNQTKQKVDIVYPRLIELIGD